MILNFISLIQIFMFVFTWDIVYEENEGMSSKSEVLQHYTHCTRRFTPGTCTGRVQPMWTFVFSLQNCTERLGCPREPRENRFRTFLRCMRHCQSLIDLYTHILARDTNETLYRNDTLSNESRRGGDDFLPHLNINYLETYDSQDPDRNDFQETLNDLDLHNIYSSNYDYENDGNIFEVKTLDEHM